MVSHIDAEDLSLVALGEAISPNDDAHLAVCEACRGELDALRAVVGSARSITDDDALVTPPARVWDAIQADLREVPPMPAVVSALDRPAGRRKAPLWAVAAAAVGGIAAGAVIAVSLPTGSSSVDTVAQATLEPLADFTVRGSADIERGEQGAVLRVSVPDLPPVDDGYYEVWMATADASTMVAVGTLNPGGEATFVLPASMRTDEFPLVDVSIEHFDGDAGHSAVSVVRGELAS